MKKETSELLKIIVYASIVINVFALIFWPLTLIIINHFEFFEMIVFVYAWMPLLILVSLMFIYTKRDMQNVKVIWRILPFLGSFVFLLSLAFIFNLWLIGFWMPFQLFVFVPSLIIGMFALYIKDIHRKIITTVSFIVISMILSLILFFASFFVIAGLMRFEPATDVDWITGDPDIARCKHKL